MTPSALATLWRKAGLKAAPARALGHCISQAFYDGGWHFYDGDMHSVYLLRDNQTVAGEQDIVRDHDLIKRTHSKGILFLDAWWSEPDMCAMYFFEGPVGGERGNKIDTTMNMVLRPGEALVWRWGQVRPLKYHGMLRDDPHVSETPIYNGLWEYRPDFSKAVWRKGAIGGGERHDGTGRPGRRRGQDGHDRLDDAQPVRLRGRPAGSGGGGGQVLHLPGWQDLEARARITSTSSSRLSVRPATSTSSSANWKGRRGCGDLAIINDLQMAPLALPEMVVGENVFTYSDQSTGGPQGADHAQLGRAVGLQAAGGAGRRRLSARWRRGERHGHCLSVGRSQRPRRRRDCRLPVRAVQPAPT